MQEINKLPKNWSDEDIVKWAGDKVKVGSKIEEEDVAKEACSRLGLEYTNVELAKEAVAEAILNEADEEPVAEDATNSEPTPTTENKEEPNAAPNVETQVKDESKPVSTQEIKSGSASVGQELFDDVMGQYLEVMKPGHSHAADEGPQMQIRFYRMIQAILRLEGTDFTNMFNQLLTTINEHRKEHFYERYVYRYFDQLKLSISDRKNFERFLNLLITTCDPKTRNTTLKQVDLNKTMDGFDDDAHQKVTSFYESI